MEHFTKEIYIYLCFHGKHNRASGMRWVKILLGSCEEEYLCKSQPIDESNNVTFLVSNLSFKNVKDIVCDDMGAWKHNGSPLKYFVVDKSSGNNDLKSSATKDPGCYILKRIYYQNISSPD